ncbi:protein translocase subunit SecDF [Mycoplasma sp. 246B]
MLISAIITIVFGSIFYIGKSSNTSIDYTNGIKTVISVKYNGNLANASETEKVNVDIAKRISGSNVTTLSDGYLLINKSGNFNDDEKSEFEHQLVDKPSLLITDSDLKPLFLEGKYNSNLSLDTADYDKLFPPFKKDGASYTPSNFDNSNFISIAVSENSEWAQATEGVLRSKDKHMLFWLNYKDLELIAKNDASGWQKANKNLWNYVHVNERVREPNAQKDNLIKENLKKYFIGSLLINQNGQPIRLSNNYTNNQATDLANEINFALDDYKLDLVSSVYAHQEIDNSTMFYTMIAAITIFVVLSIFMIVNYGILGALNTISAALYIFLTLLIFTALRGEYSPYTFIFVISSYWFFLDTSILLFDRMKHRIKKGDTQKKAIKNSYRDSVRSIVDTNILILILGIFTYFLGQNTFNIASVIYVIASVFLVFVVLIFNKYTLEFIINNGFEKKNWIYGIYRKTDTLPKSNFSKVNWIKTSNYLIIFIFIIIVVGLIVFIALSTVYKNTLASFSIDTNSGRGTMFFITDNYNNSHLGLSNSIAKELVNKLNENSELKSYNIVYNIARNSNYDYYSIIATSKQNLSDQEVIQIQKIIKGATDVSLKIDFIKLSNKELSKSLVISIILFAIFSALIVIYYIIRIGITYAVAGLLGFILLFLSLYAILFITRVPLNNYVLVAFLILESIYIYITTNLFANIKEVIRHRYHQHSLSKTDVKLVINDVISKSITKFIYLLIIIMITLIILIALNKTTNLWFGVFMLLGLLILLISSLFVTTRFFVFFEQIHQRIKINRDASGYWEVNKTEEQVFNGINDYK